MVSRKNANGSNKVKISQSDTKRALGVNNVSNASNHIGNSSGEKVELSEFHRQTKDQLKNELKKRGWKTSGNRAELLQRLDAKNMVSTVKRKNDTSVGQSNGVYAKVSSTKTREEEKEEREKLVLWRHPIKTIDYFCREFVFDLSVYGSKLLQHRILFGVSVLVTAAIFILLNVAGPHQVFLQSVRGQTLWCLYWLGLGVLSSVGLGTGLHTFLLYLGPHIAAVTIAAYECGDLRFPEPPYPDEIICSEDGASAALGWHASVWNIMSKVRVEAMMWGAGTALGELPPYFMARAARLSGYDPDDEDDLREFEELQLKKNHPDTMTLLDRAKLGVEKLVERVGFFGILACASIPNPLFDLAGITCGHFLVPFWTFFGATLVGKAVVKMHIQKMFVIIAFNETLVERAVALLAFVPVVGARLQAPFKEFLVKQKQKLHRKSSGDVPKEASSMVAWVFEKFVIGMILYFVVSIINSLAQSHHKRLHKRDHGHKRAND